MKKSTLKMRRRARARKALFFLGSIMLLASCEKPEVAERPFDFEGTVEYVHSLIGGAPDGVLDRWAEAGYEVRDSLFDDGATTCRTVRYGDLYQDIEALYVRDGRVVGFELRLTADADRPWGRMFDDEHEDYDPEWDYLSLASFARSASQRLGSQAVPYEWHLSREGERFSSEAATLEEMLAEVRPLLREDPENYPGRWHICIGAQTEEAVMETAYENGYHMLVAAYDRAFIAK